MILLIATGCTATAESSASPTPSPEITRTTEWTTPPADASPGPVEAPALTEVTGTIDESVTLPTEMVVTVGKISTTTIEPETPGEFAGPAVVVTVTVANDSGRAQSIDSAVVSLVTDDGDLGVATTAGPNQPLRGELAAGATAEGTYVFMLDPAAGRSVTVSVNYAAGEPVATFTGQVS